MCWAQKCCYCIKMDLACVLVGTISLMFSLALAVSSVIFLTINVDHQNVNQTMKQNHGYSLKAALENFELSLSKSSVQMLLYSMILVGFLMMIASVLLLIGMNKKKPGFLLYYFSFGIFFAIYCKLGALLVLLDKHWILALIVFVISLIYDHFLVVVHTVYDAMLKGKSFGFASHRSLEEDDTISVDTTFSTS